MACYLSLFLGVRLPRDIIFLGEVHHNGFFHHPTHVNVRYLDFCVREGFKRIVAPSNYLEGIQDVVAKEERYEGIQLTPLRNALEIVPKLLRHLRDSAPTT